MDKISQELNMYLREFSPDTPGQEILPLPMDKIIYIIYNSMPTTWKNKKSEKDFKHAYSIIKEITNFLRTREENI